MILCVKCVYLGTSSGCLGFVVVLCLVAETIDKKLKTTKIAALDEVKLAMTSCCFVSLSSLKRHLEININEKLRV